MTDKPLCVILGGGGHAGVVIDCMLAEGKLIPYAILEIKRSTWGQSTCDVPIRGGDEFLPDLIEEGVSTFVVGIGGIGDNVPRARLFELGLSSGLESSSLIHPSAVCARWTEIGRGTLVAPNAVVGAGATVGSNVIVNTASVVEHDCEVGDHAHIATGARLASGVRVGRLAHIGAGATVKQGMSIGEGSLVGAGAVVVTDVPDGTTVVGVPARPLGSK